MALCKKRMSGFTIQTKLSYPNTTMKTLLEFTVTVVISFALKIINLKPQTDIAEDWKLAGVVHGSANNDGITAFKDVIVKAASLPKKKGYKLLFADGLAKGETVITGEDRIKVLACRALADPDLGWSLFKEKGQKTLRYLYDTYGVKWMEFLRRELCDLDGRRNSLSLFRRDDGSWGRSNRWLSDYRNARHPALVLG